MHQPHALPAAANADHIARHEPRVAIAIGAQHRVQFFTGHAHRDRRVEPHDHRAVGKCVRTNRRDREHLRARTHNRATRGKRIRRRASRRADDQPIAAKARQHRVIHRHLEFDQARNGPARNDKIVARKLAQLLPRNRARRRDQRPRLDGKISRPHLLQRRRQIARGNRREKTQPADVDPEYRRARAAEFARDPQHRAVAAEHHDQLRRLRERRKTRDGRQGQAREPRRRLVRDDLASRGGEQRRGIAHRVAAREFVGVGDEAHAADFFSQFFQAIPKTLCCPPDRGAATR